MSILTSTPCSFLATRNPILPVFVRLPCPFLTICHPSSRSAPRSSLVAFGPKQRSIGESAKTQETSNFKNTIGSLKRLIGRTLIDPDVSEVEKKFINAKLVDVGGGVGVEVRALFPYPTEKSN